MAQPKIVAVIGATGAQGGGLVRAMLRDPARRFVPRAITRDPASEKARALAAAGVEVVQADADKPETLRGAFSGAYGAFCVTNFWEHFSPERELAQADAMARATRDAGVEHVIWSTLEDTRKWVPLEDDRMPTLMGRYKVPHFDAKGEADDLFLKHGAPTTLLLTSFYWDNLIYFGMEPKRDADGVLALTMPMGRAKLPGIAAEDIGKCAHGVLRRGTATTGQTVGIAGEHLSGEEMAAGLSAALGETVRYNAIEPAEYRALGFPGADDLGNMFQFNHDFADDFRAARPVAVARELNPELQSFESWLAANKDRIPRQ
jgi:uncharacterized protein YbjT (DUF2867 family)